jgi:PAS domain S-box-containing protein
VDSVKSIASGPSSEHSAFAPDPKWFETEHETHVVQFYSDDIPFLDGLVRYIGTALRVGDAGLVIATQAHRDEFARRMQARDVDVTAAVAQGSLVLLDARESLAKFMVDGRPDESKFVCEIGGVLDSIRAGAGNPQLRIAAFGEMVALLWLDGKRDAAIELEQLWNNLAKTHSFALRCAYPLNGFRHQSDSDPFMKICAEHSGVIPGESYTKEQTEKDRLRTIAYLQQKAEALEAEISLRHSEEKFRLLVDSVQDYAIFMLDAEGNVNSWNTGAARLKGYKASEIIGKHFSCFYPELDLRAGKPAWELEEATRVGRFEDEGWRLRKDGTRFWANVVITVLRDKNGQVTGFSKVTRDITERMEAHEALKKTNQELKNEVDQRREAERKLHDSEKSLRQLSGRLLRMQEDERRRIGRELHDSVGQYLAALKMALDSAQSDQAVQGTNARQQLVECVHLAEQSIKDLRTIAYLLYPPMLEEMGLRSAIPWYLEGFSKRSGIQIDFDISPDFGRLSRDVELVIFRVLQESLTNVHRHSGSSIACVRVIVEEGYARLEVTDYGKGIASDVLSQGADAVGSLGVGIRSMVERLQQVGGKLEISSNRHGTKMLATIPCNVSSSLSF